MIIKGDNIYEKKRIIVTVVIFAVLAALALITPLEIPLHFGISGSGTAANKYFILLFAPVSAILYWTMTKRYKN